MRRATAVFLGIVFVLGVLIGVAQAADKFAYVDLSRIFAEYNKTKDYDKVLSDKEDVYGAEREKKVGELKQFESKMGLLNEKEKETKKAELETKIKAFQDSDRQKQADLRKEQDEKMKEILKNIEDAVKQHAEKEGFTLVFNDRVFVYQTKSMDVTDKIIEILNKGYKK